MFILHLKMSSFCAGAGLEKMAMAFPPRLTGEFTKWGHLAGKMYQSLSKLFTAMPTLNIAIPHEFHFSGQPAQPQLSETAMHFPHYTECLSSGNFIICITLQHSTLL